MTRVIASSQLGHDMVGLIDRMSPDDLDVAIAYIADRMRSDRLVNALEEAVGEAERVELASRWGLYRECELDELEY